MPKAKSKTRFDLRYRMKVEELQAYQYVAHKNSGWSTRFYWGLSTAAYWLIFSIAALPIVFYAPLRQTIIEAAGFYGPPLIVFAIALALMIFHSRILMPAMLRESLDAHYGDNEIEITAASSGLVFSCGGVTTNIPWEAVERVIDAYGCIFLLATRGNGVLVPRRAFATPKEAARFLAFAKKNTKAAK